VTGKRGRRSRKLLDDLMERREYSHPKEEALFRSMWRARFGRGFGPVVKHITKWMNESGSVLRHSGATYRSIFMGQAILNFLTLRCLTFEDGTDRLLRKFGIKIPLYLHNND
jgi:hypothetical protein